MVAHTCNTSYSGGWGRRISCTWEVEVTVQWAETTQLHFSLSDKVKLCLKKKKNEISIFFILWTVNVYSQLLTAENKLIWFLIILNDSSPSSLSWSSMFSKVLRELISSVWINYTQSVGRGEWSQASEKIKYSLLKWYHNIASTFYYSESFCCNGLTFLG